MSEEKAYNPKYFCLISARKTKNRDNFDNTDLAPIADTKTRQECIPEGCVPSAAVAAGRDFYLGGCLPQCMLGYTPFVNRMTDAYENVTLAQLRTVT